MLIGVLKVELFIGEAESLKDKRKILKSLIDRIRSRFNVSIAEVGEQDVWQRSTLGIVTVSNGQAHINQVLAAIVNFINNQGTVVITDYQTQVL
ncbi:MAG: hypothetical protein A4E53_04083 [Pelotomaculum sp. PtaB.Bin104]|nr:MAG: hypothetical protein A4E53_04083 [Pelotomaculum sp. PtaB.Bin104]